MDQAEESLLSLPPESAVKVLQDFSFVNANDSLARSVYDYYERYGNRRQRMISSYYLAAIETRYNNSIEAILLFKESEALARELKDYGLEGLIQQNLAGLYFLNHQNEESLRYYKGAIESFSMFGDTVSADINRINMAEYYCRQGLFPDALSIIDSLLAEPRNNKVVENALHVRGNICFAQGKWQEADSLFSICQECGTDILGKRCLIQERMGYSFVADSLLEVAGKLCRSALDSAVYLSSARELYLMRKEFENALVVSEVFLANQRRLVSDIMRRSIPHAQKEYWKGFRLIQKLQGYNATLYVLLFILLLIVSNLLEFWLLHRRRMELISEKSTISTLQNDILQLKKELITSESLINTLLQDRINRIQKVSGTFFRWTDEAILLREEQYGKVMKEDLISEFRKELRGFQEDPSLIKEIEMALDQSRGNIMRSLRQKASQLGLNDFDFKLITLFFANFSSKSISFLLDMTDDAVRKRKSRYKKLFSEQGDSFSVYLEALK